MVVILVDLDVVVYVWCVVEVLIDVVVFYF